jgi:hypothetical protein
MPKNVRELETFKAGVEVELSMLVPRLASDPGSPVEGSVWVNTTTHTIKWYDGTSVITLGVGITNEQIMDVIGPFITDSTDLDWTYDDAGDIVSAIVKNDSITYAKIQNVSATARLLGRKTAGAGDIEELTAADVLTILGAIDAATLGGDTKATIIANAIAAVVGGAGAAYDTLVEIQGFLTADDTAIAGLLTSVAARARYYAVDLTGGATTENVDHNLALAQRGDFVARVFVKATGVAEEYYLNPTSVNRIVVTDETGGNIPAGRRIFIAAGTS